ncbi:MAG: DUF423 domain-containing protein [Bacteroidetes bacterium]|nr:DUF423 domain-containing protein [Bacteroidota bacterium]
MNKKFIAAGALLGALAVILGAFGAHYLKEKLEPAALQTFETAVRYQMYHALALLAAGILYKDFPNGLLKWSGNLFMLGMVFFSGSLYVLCADATQRWAGPVTPLGGLCFICGWLLLAAGVMKKH